MIVTSQKIVLNPDKKKEFLQTVKLLAHQISNEKGCMVCRIYQDVESQNNLLIRSEWNNREALGRHLQSDRFRILLGAISLLGDVRKSSRLEVSTVKDTEVLDLLQMIDGTKKELFSRG